MILNILAKLNKNAKKKYNVKCLTVSLGTVGKHYIHKCTHNKYE